LEIVDSNFPQRVNTRIVSNSLSELESKFLDLDSGYAKKILNWSPAWNQEEAIISTFKWWTSYLDKKMDPNEISKFDIRELLSFHKIDSR
jgi:hypothetical protein